MQVHIHSWSMFIFHWNVWCTTCLDGSLGMRSGRVIGHFFFFLLWNRRLVLSGQRLFKPVRDLSHSRFCVSLDFNHRAGRLENTHELFLKEELTSYHQSQSAGYDADIGQQIQEPHKLGGQKNNSIIILSTNVSLVPSIPQSTTSLWSCKHVTLWP